MAGQHRQADCGAEQTGRLYRPPAATVLHQRPAPAPRVHHRERLRAALEDVCGRAAADSIQLQLAQDGSVLGAAILAVAAAEYERKGGSSG